MTVQELAETAGLMRQGLTEIELGQRMPTLPTLYAIAKVLGCEVAEFLPPLKNSPKSEALAELVAAASKYPPAAIARFSKMVTVLQEMK